jgi:intergrase/recombinase
MSYEEEIDAIRELQRSMIEKVKEFQEHERVAMEELCEKVEGRNAKETLEDLRRSIERVKGFKKEFYKINKESRKEMTPIIMAFGRIDRELRKKMREIQRRFRG